MRGSSEHSPLGDRRQSSAKHVLAGQGGAATVHGCVSPSGVHLVPVCRAPHASWCGSGPAIRALETSSPGVTAGWPWQVTHPPLAGSIIGSPGGACEGSACLQWIDVSLPSPPPRSTQCCPSSLSPTQRPQVKDSRSPLCLGPPWVPAGTDLGRTRSQLERCARASLPRVSEGISVAPRKGHRVPGATDQP